MQNFFQNSVASTDREVTKRPDKTRYGKVGQEKRKCHKWNILFQEKFEGEERRGKERKRKEKKGQVGEKRNGKRERQ